MIVINGDAFWSALDLFDRDMKSDVRFSWIGFKGDHKLILREFQRFLALWKGKKFD